jgi:hypothetical protein
MGYHSSRGFKISTLATLLLRFLVGLGLSALLIGCSTSQSANPSNSSNQSSADPTSSLRANAETLATEGQNLPISAQAEINGQIIQLEVAETPQQQAMGLMFRPELAANRGMLFSFSPARPVQFWMKNVAIPLDMVFLQDGVVRAIAANVPPCTTAPCPVYGPDTAVDQVIELRGGRAAELGLEAGDSVTVEFLD